RNSTPHDGKSLRLRSLVLLFGCKQRFKARRKSQLRSVLLPQGVSRRLRQIAKPDPYIASGRTGEIFPPDLLQLLREVWIDAIGVECLRICPLDLCSFWIDPKTGFLADREPSLPLLICHDRSHLLSPFCSSFRLLFPRTARIQNPLARSGVRAFCIAP